MQNQSAKSASGQYGPEAFFQKVIAWRRAIVAAALAVVVVFGASLTGLQKDTRPEAFIPVDHPALAKRERVREVFGLSDPIVVALVAKPGESVFTPQGLGLVERISRELEEISGIDTARITSLATENDIIGSELGLEVRPFFDEIPATLEEAAAVREAVRDFPLYVGSIVSEDGRAALIAAEIEVDADAGDVYAAVLEMSRTIEVPPGLVLHVAGEAGVTGHLGDYIDADSRRMIPIAFVLIILVLFRAYRTVRSVTLPLLVVVGGVAVAIGSMAAAGVPYTLISTALPVVLVAIGVADAIHILGQYELELERDPRASQRQLVVRSMCEMWRPVTITSVTDSIGFLSIAASTSIPPMRSFGLFAAIGVTALWAFSLLVVPAVLSMLGRSTRMRRIEARMASRASREGGPISAPGASGILSRIGAAFARRPERALAVAGLLAVAGALGAGQVSVDYERIRNFQAEEPIARADRAINRHLDGTNYLDVMIEGEQPNALLDPQVLRRIETFQQQIGQVSHVRGSTSIVDYLTRMHRAFRGDRADAARLPDDRASVGQLLLLYEMQSDPDSLERVMDFERQRTNVRVYLDSGRYSDEREVVAAAHALLGSLLAETPLEYHLAGRVNVDAEWMSDIGRSHVVSVILALLGILIASALLFGSFAAGLLTTAPVALAVLVLYAVMAVTDLWLGVTTAMFAAIAIGLGVDFSVHLIDRLRVLRETSGETLEADFSVLFEETGRVLFFNFASVSLGLGALTLSRVPVIAEFGLLTAVAVTGAFLASMSVVPALAAILQPKFLRVPGQVLEGKAAEGGVVAGWQDPLARPESNPGSPATAPAPALRSATGNSESASIPIPRA